MERIRRVVLATLCAGVAVAAWQEIEPLTPASVAGTYVPNFDSTAELVLRADRTYWEKDATGLVTTGTFTIDHGEQLALRRPNGGFSAPRIGPRLLRMCVSEDPDLNRYLCRR